MEAVMLFSAPSQYSCKRLYNIIHLLHRMDEKSSEWTWYITDVSCSRSCCTLCLSVAHVMPLICGNLKYKCIKPPCWGGWHLGFFLYNCQDWRNIQKTGRNNHAPLTGHESWWVVNHPDLDANA